MKNLKKKKKQTKFVIVWGGGDLKLEGGTFPLKALKKTLL